MWMYPMPGEIGVVVHTATGRCWSNTQNDGCAWGGSGANFSCIELIDAADCAAGAALWNVTAGIGNSTVVFRFDGLGRNLCADWNSALAVLELYPCYGAENKQQEWFENLMDNKMGHIS